MKVLCAFQNEEVFDFVKSALQSFECEFLKASSESLALFLTQKNYPCLLVCELSANERWGINLLAELKAAPELSLIPLVFLLRREDFALFEGQTTDCGADMVISYPIEDYEFTKRVAPYLLDLKDDRVMETPE